MSQVLFSREYKQLYYDIARDHLLSQGVKSLGPPDKDSKLPSCLYLDAHGHKCAIGIFMHPDSARLLEGSSAAVSPVLKAIGLGDLSDKAHDEACRFLSELQSVHDDYRTELWPLMLGDLAEAYNLEP